MSSFTINEISIACQVTERTVRRWCRCGKLEKHKISGKTLFYKIVDKEIRFRMADNGGQWRTMADIETAKPLKN